MRQSLLISSSIIFIAITGVNAGEFVPRDGYPVFKPGPVECRAEMAPNAVCFELAEDFGYINIYRGERIGFQAAAGLITDGASIPGWAQDAIGDPHDQAFSRAATIHDHYVLRENAVYDYFLTQRVFFDILIDSGVDRGTANLMYAAVLVFAPKWTVFYDAPPDHCIGMGDVFCVRNAEGEPDNIINYVDGVYGDPDASAALEDLLTGVDLDAVTPEIVEGLALLARARAGLETPVPVAFGDDN